MVASFRALGKKVKSSSQRAAIYAIVNYFLHCGEPSGTWWGRAAEALALSGEVERDPFFAVLAGYEPRGIKRLVQIQRRKRKGRRRRKGDDPPDDDLPGDVDDTPDAKSGSRQRLNRSPGADVCFTVPKSVSALWAVSPKHIREEIEQALVVAVTRILEWIQAEIPLARRGSGGWQRELADLVAATFRHSVNRNLEPNLHVHVIFANLIRRNDGSWGTLNTALLRDWTRTLGPMFRACFGAELVRRLGVGLYQPKGKNGQEQGWPEIIGVPKKLMEHWSSRKNEIDELINAKAHELGGNTAQARQEANLRSRKSKVRLPAQDELFKRWHEEAKRFGFDQQKAQRLIGSRKTARKKDYQQVRDQAIARITKYQSDFFERDLIRHVCEAMQDQGIDGIHIAERVRADLAMSPDIVRLKNTDGEQRFTTREMWELEEKLLGQVVQLQKRPGAAVSESVIAKVLKPGFKNLPKLKRRKPLNSEQTQAVREFLSSRQQIRVNSYVSGAGNTHMFDVVREGFERAGYRVIGGAVTGTQKEELVRQTGMDSRTAASYLHHLDKSKLRAAWDRARHDAKQLLRAIRGKQTYGYAPLKLTPRDVIVLDAATMLDTRTMERFADHALKSGATLILAGDERQPASALAGGPFKRIAKMVGHSQLTGNQRQLDEHDREAVQDIRHGDGKKALKNYAERGRIIIGKDRQATIQAAVKKWSDQGGARQPQDHRIFTSTRADAHVVNALCQAERHQLGQLRSLLPIRLGNVRIYKGDRVLFHMAYRPVGIENGSQATVIGINPALRQITVFLDGEPSAQDKARGLTRVVTVPLKKLGKDGIALGYAQAPQGQTVSNSYMLLGGSMTSQEMAYVQSTRGRTT